MELPLLQVREEVRRSIDEPISQGSENRISVLGLDALRSIEIFSQFQLSVGGFVLKSGGDWSNATSSYLEVK
jgi:hypothetical protein